MQQIIEAALVVRAVGQVAHLVVSAADAAAAVELFESDAAGERTGRSRIRDGFETTKAGSDRPVEPIQKAEPSQGDVLRIVEVDHPSGRTQSQLVAAARTEPVIVDGWRDQRHAISRRRAGLASQTALGGDAIDSPAGG